MQAGKGPPLHARAVHRVFKILVDSGPLVAEEVEQLAFLGRSRRGRRNDIGGYAGGGLGYRRLAGHDVVVNHVMLKDQEPLMSGKQCRHFPRYSPSSWIAEW